MPASKKGRGGAGNAMEIGDGKEPELKLKADLDYEDEAEDEFEEEEVVAYGDESDASDCEEGAAPPPLEDDGAQADGDGAGTRVWRAGVDQLAADEELEFDPSAYDVMHHFHSDWPCLSFAVVPDNMGSGRTKAPFSALLVAGTQASQPSENKLLVMKLAKLPRIRHDRDEDDMDDDDDDDDEALLLSGIVLPVVSQVRPGRSARLRDLTDLGKTCKRCRPLTRPRHARALPAVAIARCGAQVLPLDDQEEEEALAGPSASARVSPVS